MSGFSMIYRNPGHYDFCSKGGRDFRIRGEAGNVVVYDERHDESRPFPRPDLRFGSVHAALLWIADIYIAECERTNP